jgi:SAM-dependent methyltransferase
MTNPWLQIPASDYEGHMGSPHVAQLSFLAQAFKESLDKYESSSIAMLGCATGNGLEYVKKDTTRRVTAIDINPEYLEIVRKRYEGRVLGLEVMEADLEACTVENQAYSLIFAGLIFEYLEPRILLPKIARWLRSGGVMVSILQLPAQHLARVSETPYVSLKALNPVMKLVSPQQFQSIANDAGLQEIEAKTVTLESGKPFYIGTYTKV